MSKLNTRKSIVGMRRGSLLNVGKNTKTEKSEFFFSSHGYSIASDITVYANLNLGHMAH